MSLSKFVLSSSLFAACTLQVHGHSWVHCTDYDGTINGQDFTEGNCNGYIPSYADQWGGVGFAVDRGINYQASGSAWCQAGVDDGYSDAYPMAKWDYDDEITLVWPAKNHANYGCFNNIPDTSMKLFYYPVANAASYPTNTQLNYGDSTDYDGWVQLINWHADCTAGSDGCGFQNCPDFCANTDGAPCFGTYTVESSRFPTAGTYQLMWYWIFNQDTDPYTTCFQVEITGDTADGSDNNDGGDDDDNDGGSTTRFDEFIVSVPVCLTGVEYDETTLLSGANSADFEVETVVSWIRSAAINGDQSSDWNTTIQTNTNNAGDVTLTSYDYADDSSDLCDSIEDAFGSGTCEICDPGLMRTFGLIDAASSLYGGKWVHSLLFAVVSVFAVWFMS